MCTYKHLSRFKNEEIILFSVLIIAHIALVWLFKYFPTQDGPAHVYNSSLILQLNHPVYDVFREYLTVNFRLDPTWFSHLLLSALLAVFPFLTAEKILVSIYVLLLPLAARYTLGVIRQESKFLAILFFPFIFNYLLHMGFYAFSMSLPIALFTIGFWIKHQDHLSLKNIVLLALLSTILYFNHLVSFAMTCLIIAVLFSGSFLLDMWASIQNHLSDLRSVCHSAAFKALKTLAAFSIAAVLAALFVFSRETQHAAGQPLVPRFSDFVHVMSIVSYDHREIWFSSALMVFLIAISFYFFIRNVEKGGFNRQDLLLVVCAACFLFYLKVPQTELVSEHGLAGGLFMDYRVSFYPYFMLMFWLGTQTFSKPMRRTIQIFACMIVIGLLGLNLKSHSKINDYLNEYTSVSYLIEPGSTLLPLESCDDQWQMAYKNRIAPLLHASAYIATERAVLSLRNYEANMGYFPFIYKYEKNPYRHIGKIECHLEPAPLDFRTYPERTGGRIDYILVWLGKEVNVNHDNLKSIYRQLESDFELIYQSPQRGWIELYRRVDNRSDRTAPSALRLD